MSTTKVAGSTSTTGVRTSVHFSIPGRTEFEGFLRTIAPYISTENLAQLHTTLPKRVLTERWSARGQYWRTVVELDVSSGVVLVPMTADPSQDIRVSYLDDNFGWGITLGVAAGPITAHVLWPVARTVEPVLCRHER